MLAAAVDGDAVLKLRIYGAKTLLHTSSRRSALVKLNNNFSFIDVLMLLANRSDGRVM
jgi:hypothetical protein